MNRDGWDHPSARVISPIPYVVRTARVATRPMLILIGRPVAVGPRVEIARCGEAFVYLTLRSPELFQSQSFRVRRTVRFTCERRFIPPWWTPLFYPYGWEPAVCV